MPTMREVGAGGYWQVLDEKFAASIVKQANPLACVAAVGEMLLQARGGQISQVEIARIIGTPSHAEALALPGLSAHRPTPKPWRSI